MDRDTLVQLIMAAMQGNRPSTLRPESNVEKYIPESWKTEGWNRAPPPPFVAPPGMERLVPDTFLNPPPPSGFPPRSRTPMGPPTGPPTRVPGGARIERERLLPRKEQLV